MSVKRLCVFCGSSPGARPEYGEAARRLAGALVERKIGLVYGGGGIGLMGQVAQAVLAQGGEVIGVIPQGLVDKELAFRELADLRVVDSMHERKALMAELSDGFMALPGGLGTIEEFFEVLSWAQLGLHGKPCGLLNVCQYYTPLMRFLDHAVDQRFMEPEHRSMILVDEEPAGLLDEFATYRPPEIDKVRWILRMAGR